MNFRLKDGSIEVEFYSLEGEMMKEEVLALFTCRMFCASRTKNDVTN